jgi:PAS domain S-box-containing protein
MAFAMAVEAARPRDWLRGRPELAVLAAFLIVYASWLAVSWIPGDAQKLQILFLAPIDALVVYSAWRASQRSVEVPWLRTFWRLVMIAWTAELIADLTLAVYDIVLEEPAFPSAADFVFLAFYPLLLVALLRIPHSSATRYRKLRIALDCASIVVGGAAAVWYFLLGPILAEGGEGVFEGAVSVAYPIGDVLLLGALALVLVRGSPQVLKLPLRWLTVGLLMLICADTIYGAAQLHGTYSPGDPVDTLYVLMAAPFILAAARQLEVRAGDPGVRVDGAPETSSPVAWLPLAAMLVGFGLLLATQWNDSFFPDFSLLIFAIALAALAAARQHFAQVELGQLRARVQTILDGVAEGIIAFDEQGAIIWVNPAGERYFGAPAEGLEGEPVDTLFEGVSWSEMVPMLGTAEAPGPVLNTRVKFTGRRRDGSLFPAEIVVTETILDGERTLIAIGQDVSERASAEAALRESERRFRGIFDNAGVGIAFSGFRDGRPRIVEVNEAFVRMTGYSPEELRDDDFSLITHPDDLSDLAEIGAAVSSGQNSIAREPRCVRKDGRGLWGALTVSILRDEDGEPRYAIGMLADITARKEAERVKDEFVSVVGHELRTPLTSIRGSLGLLEGGVMGELPREAVAMLGTAVSNTDRLVRLVNDILDLERIDSGGTRLEPAPVSAAELVEQSVQVLGGTAEQAGVAVRVEGENPEVAADPDRIVQALVNLIGNAIKFSEPGAAVTVRVGLDAAEAVFSVEDTGRGIPADMLESVFERFTQVDSTDARERAGTGLGLAIARSIVELHGGRIWAESVAGEGATLSFTLPLARTEVGADQR